MKYWNDKNIELYNGDCYEIIKKMHNDSVDHVITSPPYNMNLRIRNGKYCSRQIVKEFSTKYIGFDDNLPIEVYFDFHKNVINELLRVTKKYIFYIIQPVTGNKRALYKLMGEFNENLKEVIIWNKVSAQPAMAEKVMNSVYEYILILTKDKSDSISRQFKNSNFERGKLDNIWNIKREKSISKDHSATFPKKLINNIIINFTNELDVILDPFSGTGTTGVSCIENNRKYIGIELLNNYFEISITRLKKL